MNLIASNSDGEASSSEAQISIDKSVHPLSVVKKAALKFTDTCVFDFSDKGEEVKVRISFRSALPQAEQDNIVDEFRIELLDQELRETIAKETEPVRNLILANVFSKAAAVKEKE